MINLRDEGAVRVLEMDAGTANAFGPGLTGALRRALDEAARSPGVRGLVLASASARFFSIGFDLPSILPLDRPAMTEFFAEANRLWRDLLAFPGPVVAAIEHHAVAGGCIAALCCDYRIVEEGRVLVGINEIKLGVPNPLLADAALRAIVGGRRARDVVGFAEFHEPEAARALGLVDEVVPKGQARSRAIERAASLGAADAYAAAKRIRMRPVLDEYARCGREEDEAFLDLWFSKETRRRLEEALPRFPKD
jgi:3,2-trans-enoyl-CoA isomerase